MSIFWNPRTRKPQPWVYLPFVVMTALLVFFVYNYGASKARNADAAPAQQAEAGK